LRLGAIGAKKSAATQKRTAAAIRYRNVMARIYTRAKRGS